MHSTVIDIETIEEQQAVFGVNDELAKILENNLKVSVGARDEKIEIRGESELDVTVAQEVIYSMVEILNKGESLNSDVVYRLIEEAQRGNLKETCKAMGDPITLNFRGIPIRCKTIGQRNYVQALKDNTVTLCIGPAGTGKTYLAVAYAAEEFKKGNIEKIIMSRPAIEAGEERLGFLPGDLAQKVDPYLRPLYDALNDIFGAERAEKLRERGEIEIAPLAYMRGRTLSHAAVIVDEAQNASLSTLKMALTRLGEGSKMILTGDVTQIDLPHAADSGLEHCARILAPIEGISVTKLNNRDVVRQKLVRDIVKAFEKDEASRQNHQNKRTSQNTKNKNK